MEYQYLDKAHYYEELALGCEDTAIWYKAKASAVTRNPNLKNDYEEKANEALRQAKEYRRNAKDAKELFEYYRRHNG